MQRSRNRILILGGGFAGVFAARELGRTLRGTDGRVAIVNRENFFVFYPMLPEVISGGISTEDVLNPIRLIAPRAKLYVGTVTNIDLEHKRVEIKHGLYQHRQEPLTLYCDHLVLALGGVPATSRIPGLAEYAFDVQRLSNAFALRNHVIDTLEQAAIERDADAKRRLLTFVIVGGGATGVEVAAELRALVDDASRYYANVRHDDMRVIIVEYGQRLLPDLPDRLTNHALRALREHHVEVLLGTGVTAVEPNLVRLSTGETLATNTVVGSVGVQPNPLLSGLALPFDERGRIKVDDTLRVGGYSNVWALGDDASITDPNTGKPYPQTAQHAVRAARLLADNIAATIEGRPLEPMTYKTLGTMVALGHHNAVAQIGRFAMTGLLAWWIWRTYYLFQLPRWEKRLRVMFDWTLDLVAPPALVQLKVGQPAPMARRGTRDQGLGN